MDNDKQPSITLKLTPKGVYHWSIHLPRRDGESVSKFVERLEKLDLELKRHFTNHAKKVRSSFRSETILPD